MEWIAKSIIRHIAKLVPSYYGNLQYKKESWRGLSEAEIVDIIQAIFLGNGYYTWREVRYSYIDEDQKYPDEGNETPILDLYTNSPIGGNDPPWHVEAKVFLDKDERMVESRSGDVTKDFVNLTKLIDYDFSGHFLVVWVIFSSHKDESLGKRKGSYCLKDAENNITDFYKNFELYKHPIFNLEAIYKKNQDKKDVKNIRYVHVYTWKRIVEED